MQSTAGLLQHHVSKAAQPGTAPSRKPQSKFFSTWTRHLLVVKCGSVMYCKAAEKAVRNDLKL